MLPRPFAGSASLWRHIALLPGVWRSEEWFKLNRVMELHVANLRLNRVLSDLWLDNLIINKIVVLLFLAPHVGALYPTWPLHLLHSIDAELHSAGSAI